MQIFVPIYDFLHSKVTFFLGTPNLIPADAKDNCDSDRLKSVIAKLM